MMQVMFNVSIGSNSGHSLEQNHGKTKALPERFIAISSQKPAEIPVQRWQQVIYNFPTGTTKHRQCTYLNHRQLRNLPHALWKHVQYTHRLTRNLW